jgi:hypothetical protein
MSNQTLEAFVNSIQNLYQINSQHQLQKSPQQQNQTQPSSSKNQNLHQDLNYTDIFNTINSNLGIFHENASSNLIDNLLPIFTLPEYTLPNMAVLYAIVSQQSAATSASIARQDLGVDTGNEGNNNSTGAAVLSVNPDRLLNEIENCIQFSDEKQVNQTFISYFLVFYDES